MRSLSECEKKRVSTKMALFKAWITEILANSSLVTHAVEEGLYQVAYRNGWDADVKAEFSPSLRLFACCKGAQKKQELRITSQQALSWSFQRTLSASLRLFCCGYRTCTQIQNTVWQANHLQLLFSVGYTTQ